VPESLYAVVPELTMVIHRLCHAGGVDNGGMRAIVVVVKASATARLRTRTPELALCPTSAPSPPRAGRVSCAGCRRTH